MATMNKQNNGYTNINSMTLSSGLLMQIGLLPVNAGTISGTSGGVTTLCTVATGRSYGVTGILLRMTADTSLTGTATLSIGTNASTYDNIMPSTALTGWSSINEIYHFVPQGTVWFAGSGQNIRLNLTGVFGGTVTFEASLMGIII